MILVLESREIGCLLGVWVIGSEVSRITTFAKFVQLGHIFSEDGMSHSMNLLSDLNVMCSEDESYFQTDIDSETSPGEPWFV
jgi:hypothetical protein